MSKQHQSRTRRPVGRLGFGLIELLVVLVVLAILATVLSRFLLGGKDAAGRTVATPKQRAQQTVGVSYISQIYQAMDLYRMDYEGENPPNLEALKRYGVVDEMLRDPVTKQLLRYNPQTGKVDVPPGYPSQTALPPTSGF